MLIRSYSSKKDVIRQPKSLEEVEEKKIYSSKVEDVSDSGANKLILQSI